MPNCNEYSEHPITASHRPALVWMTTYLLLDTVKKSVPVNEREAGEPAPNACTEEAAVNLVAQIPFSLVGHPDVSSFWGEIHLTWTSGAKQVVVMCFPDRTPLIHHYQRAANAPSRHDIEAATPDRVTHWLRWLRD